MTEDTYDIYGKTVTLDPNTGLPLLPGGFFWRIRKERMIDPPIKIELRRKKLLGSVLVQHAWGHRVSRRSIVHEAAFCYSRWVGECAQRRENQSRKRELNDLIGDYPPKSLAGR